MKRWVFILILLLVVLFELPAISAETETEKEILFRNIEWMDDAFSVYNKVKSFGAYVREPSEAWYVYTWNDLDIHMDYSLGYDIGIIGDNNTLVGGHIVDKAWLYFLYDYSDGKIDTTPENTHFYIACYELRTGDVERTYEDLVEKMTGLYGKGELKITSVSGTYFKTQPSVSYNGEIRTITWYGTANTAVKIIAEINTPSDRVSEVKSATESIQIWYGKTDMDDIIREMELSIENSFTSENSGSTDGL